MLKFLKSLVCKHDYKFSCNIYGDSINYLNGRSIWECKKCEKVKVTWVFVDEGIKQQEWIFDKKWKTGTVVALASIMLRDDDYSAMPILADAMMDAGCDQSYLELMRDCKYRFYPGKWLLQEILS